MSWLILEIPVQDPRPGHATPENPRTVQGIPHQTASTFGSRCSFSLSYFSPCLFLFLSSFCSRLASSVMFSEFGEVCGLAHVQTSVRFLVERFRWRFCLNPGHKLRYFSVPTNQWKLVLFYRVRVEDLDWNSPLPFSGYTLFCTGSHNARKNRCRG